MTQLPNNPEIFQPLSTNELASDRTELAKYRSRAAADPYPNGLDSHFFVPHWFWFRPADHCRNDSKSLGGESD
jgi:hypothetical protein